MTRRTRVRILGIAAVTCVTLQAGCTKDRPEEARPPGTASGTAGEATPHGGAGGAPHGSMPALGGSPGSTAEPTDGHALPLKLTGLGSAAELQRELGKLQNQDDAAAFERAFRLTFTTDKTQRGYSEATGLLAPLTAAHSNFAPAYRTLAYAKFNMNVTEPGEPLALYEKSVEIDPQYGEAHYAIAFMHTMVDPRKGAEHFKKAMALGVPDERNIGPNFYPHALETP